MPAITSGKVLVTGANGYIAQWIVERLLKQGFTVRGTVRSESKAARLRHLFASYGDRLDVVIVEDITKDGAFDDAVQDVDAILHTASLTKIVNDPDEYIVPAVRGTTGILESARTHGSRVQRVVVLSSCAAVSCLSMSEGSSSEADWNDEAVAIVQISGHAASPIIMYCASKVLAERAAWEFVAKYGEQLAWDLVVLNPSWVYGAPLDVEEGISTSLQYWFECVFLNGGNSLPTTAWMAWVDVHQLADTHVLALQKSEAGGQRIIVAAESYVWQEWVNAVSKIDRSVPPGDTASEEEKAPPPVRFISDKAERIFGIKWISKEECVRDMLPFFKIKRMLGVQ